MAKSYVTKFTEYVAEQRNALSTILKNKDISVQGNDTFDVLIDKVRYIDKAYDHYPQYYERDVNLPNIDEMFDNDPLRLANGGEYPYCAYFLARLDSNNKVGLYFYWSATSSYTTNKVIVSDGSEFDLTATLTQVLEVAENGIYTDSNGLKYCLVRAYSLTPHNYSSYKNNVTNVIELIEDRDTQAITPKQYVNTGVQQIITDSGYKYIRFEFSNVGDTVASISGSATISADTFVTNGRCASTGYTLACNKVIFNHTQVGTAASTKLSFSIGGYSSNSQSYFGGRVCEYLKLPKGLLPIELSLTAIIIRELDLSDNITKLSYSGGESSTYSYFRIVSKIHFGNGLTAVPSVSLGSTGSYSDKYYFNVSLTDVTVSPNAFGLNTSAITLDFSYAYNLTRESVLNMFNNFADRTDMTANILKLNAIQKALVTDEEKAILTNKNWTLS